MPSRDPEPARTGPPVRILLRSNTWSPSNGGRVLQYLMLRIINDDDGVFIDYPLPASVEEYLATPPRVFERLTEMFMHDTRGPVLGGLSIRQRHALRDFMDIWITHRSPRFGGLIQIMISTGARAYPAHEPVHHDRQLEFLCILARRAFPETGEVA